MIWNIFYIILQSLLKDGYGENYILNFLSVDVKQSTYTDCIAFQANNSTIWLGSVQLIHDNYKITL